MSKKVYVQRNEDGEIVGVFDCPQFDENGNSTTPELIDEDQAFSIRVVRSEKSRIVDQEAENARLRFITGGAAQAMVYQRKAQEAALYVETTNPDPSDFPLLNAEVGITGATIEDVANVVIDKQNEWLVAAALIEVTRLTAKAQIEAAANPTQIEAILLNLEWPKP